MRLWPCILLVAGLVPAVLGGDDEFAHLPEKVRAYLVPTPVEGVHDVKVEEAGVIVARGELRVHRIPHTPALIEVNLRPTLDALYDAQAERYWRSLDAAGVDTAPKAWARPQSSRR